MTVGVAALLAAAALIPVSAAAYHAGGSAQAHDSHRSASDTRGSRAISGEPSSAPTSLPATPGVVSTVAEDEPRVSIQPADVMSAGWAISMPEHHPAVSVALSHIVATIPLVCTIAGLDVKLVTLVLSMPDASVTLPADDMSWSGPTSPASALGYQASQLMAALCHGTEVEPGGRIAYAAKLVSTDTRDAFAVRFHSVDAKSSHGVAIDCGSLAQNPIGVSQCNAPWTTVTTTLAVAPPFVTQPVPTVTTPLPGPVTGAVTGPVRRITGGGHASRSSRTPSSAAAASSGPVGGAAVTSPPPVLVLPAVPAPSHSTVLGPVPVMVPVIDAVAPGAGGALPWKWFVLLGILDIGLVSGIVIRRRYARGEGADGRQDGVRTAVSGGVRPPAPSR